ncbi:MAG: tetratricopeptide repeat protein [Bacteroidales bacterium]|nr:tetratricopeptide repeat protein [Bacteroidales bacterium]
MLRPKIFTFFNLCLLPFAFCLVSFALCLFSSPSFSQNTDDSPSKDEQLAAQYYQNKEYDKAVELYSKLFNKNSAFYYQPYLDCFIELMDFDKAEKLIKKQIKQNPESPKYKVDLGFIYKLQKENKKSEKQFESSIDELTANQQQVLELGSAFENKLEFDFAIKTYLKGRKLLKGYCPFFIELANVYGKINNFSSMFGEYLDAIETNPEYLEQIQAVFQSIIANDQDNKKTEILKNLIITKSQKNPENLVLSEMLVWLAIQLRDFESAFIQAKAIDKRFKEDGHRLIEVAKIFSDNENYETAIKSYQYVINKGKDNPYFITAKIFLANVMMLKITTKRNYTTEELKELEKVYTSTIEELGKNPNTIYLLKDYAHLEAFYLNNTDTAISILTEAIDISGNSQQAKAQCKIELADIYLLTGEIWEATLLYSQVEKALKNDPLGHLAKFKNAKLSFYRGDFIWAQAQLDILKAATSKLISNDAIELSLLIGDNIDADSNYAPLLLYARADLSAFQNKYDDAQKTLDSILTFFKDHPIVDDAVYKKAELYFAVGNYKDAAELFKKVNDEYGNDIRGDDALFKLAEINEKFLKDTTKAKELYQELLTKYPGSIYVVEARKRFRTLRGDVVN